LENWETIGKNETTIRKKLNNNWKTMRKRLENNETTIGKLLEKNESNLNNDKLNIFCHRKNIIMRFLRLLLFFFVLVLPPTSSQDISLHHCSMGESGGCESCCKECLYDIEDYLEHRNPPTPAVCRQRCQPSCRKLENN